MKSLKQNCKTIYMKFSQSGELLLTLILKCLASLWPSSSCPFPVFQLKGHLSWAFFKRRSLLSTNTRGSLFHFWSWSERGRLTSIPWIWCYLSVFINLQQHWLKRSAKWCQNRHCFLVSLPWVFDRWHTFTCPASSDLLKTHGALSWNITSVHLKTW